MANLLAADLDYVVESVSPFWQQLNNQRIFITGGTGFFGCWLLESFIWATEKLGLNTQATVLTRNKAAFQQKCSWLANHPAVDLYEGDVKNFIFPKENYSHIIHAATEVADASLYLTKPAQMLDTIIQGTAQTLAFARHCGAVRYLLVSSGAVYGKQPPEMSHLSEDYRGSPRIEDIGSTYGMGKCIAEHLCHIYKKNYNINATIARCFAVVGPYLPLNAHFAMGNFLRDLMRNKPIVVNGDGTPFRSYLYMSDLTIWLWRILFCGQPVRPYNVGSDKAMSIAELAHFIAGIFSPAKEVIITQQASPTLLPERYIPDTTRARNELGLTQKIALEQAIHATLRWYSQKVY